MNKFRVDLTWFDDLLDFNDDFFSSGSHISIEVSCCFIEIQISECVCFLSFNQSKITENSFLFNVFSSSEGSYIFWL